jgi:hypothetical protein
VRRVYFAELCIKLTSGQLYFFQSIQNLKRVDGGSEQVGVEISDDAPLPTNTRILLQLVLVKALMHEACPFTVLLYAIEKVSHFLVCLSAPPVQNSEQVVQSFKRVSLRVQVKLTRVVEQFEELFADFQTLQLWNPGFSIFFKYAFIKLFNTLDNW